MKKYLIALDLIRSGCQMSKPDVEGFTPLHHAARTEDLKAVKLLLDCGLRHRECRHSSGSLTGRYIPPPMLNYIVNYK